MERTIAAAREDPILFPKHLPPHIRIDVARASISKEVSTKDREMSSVETLPTLHDFREQIVSEAEKNYLKDLMSLAGGNVKEACTISGLSRPRLYALLKKYHISRSD